MKKAFRGVCYGRLGNRIDGRQAAVRSGKNQSWPPSTTMSSGLTSEPYTGFKVSS